MDVERLTETRIHRFGGRPPENFLSYEAKNKTEPIIDFAEKKRKRLVEETISEPKRPKREKLENDIKEAKNISLQSEAIHVQTKTPSDKETSKEERYVVALEEGGKQRIKIAQNYIKSFSDFSDLNLQKKSENKLDKAETSANPKVSSEETETDAIGEEEEIIKSGEEGDTVEVVGDTEATTLATQLHVADTCQEDREKGEKGIKNLKLHLVGNNPETVFIKEINKKTEEIGTAEKCVRAVKQSEPDMIAPELNDSGETTEETSR